MSEEPYIADQCRAHADDEGDDSLAGMVFQAAAEEIENRDILLAAFQNFVVGEGHRPDFEATLDDEEVAIYESLFPSNGTSAYERFALYPLGDDGDGE